MGHAANPATPKVPLGRSLLACGPGPSFRGFIGIATGKLLAVRLPGFGPGPAGDLTLDRAQVRGSREMDTDRSRSFWRRRRVLLLLGLALAAVSVTATSFSLGLWTDQAVVGGNTFTAGTIDISTSPASAVIGLNPMMPGDTVNGTLTVNNAGTAQLRYALSSSSTNADAKALRDGITLDIKLRDVAADVCTAF